MWNFKVQISRHHQQLVNIDKFTIVPGEINFLLGESGIGKSLISRAVFGLLDPAELNITINKLDYREYQHNGFVRFNLNHGFFVFQEPSSHLNPLIRIKWQLNEGSIGRPLDESEILQSLWPEDKKDDFKNIMNIYPKPFRPSGGEKQRVLLTMAFKKINRFISDKIKGQPLFIFDEPTGNLDDNLRNRFIHLLFEKYSQRKFTILFITHDYSIIGELSRKYKKYSDDIIFTELRRKDQKLSQFKFEHQTYINWLKKASQIGIKKKNESKKLLHLDSVVETDSRKFTFSANNSGKKISDLEIHANEIIYLKAGSGVGKTTISKIMMGLFQALQFKMRILNYDIYPDTSEATWHKKVWGKLLTMTFQHADEALNLKSTVSATFNMLPKDIRPAPDMLINQIKLFFPEENLASILKKKIMHLSGGQKQRLNLLRAFALNTPLLILDEPLNGLDFSSIKRVIELMDKKRSQGCGILLISHNEEIFDSIIDKKNIYYLQSEIKTN